MPSEEQLFPEQSALAPQEAPLLEVREAGLVKAEMRINIFLGLMKLREVMPTTQEATMQEIQRILEVPMVIVLRALNQVATAAAARRLLLIMSATLDLLELVAKGKGPMAVPKAPTLEARE